MQKIHLATSGQLAELIIARLSLYPIEGIEEKTTGIDVYVRDEMLKESAFRDELEFLSAQMEVSYTISPQMEENWNARWEASYQPITIRDQVRIRASFHEPDGRYPYDIVIDPKMAFGTGHHPTTTLMMTRMLQYDLKNATVLDMGCGTGILSVLAGMMGARHIDAIDIDRWSFENAQQNAKINGIDIMHVINGSVEDIPPGKYDFILANINREIIAGQLWYYCKRLAKKGTVLTSGYFTKDEQRLLSAAHEHNLQSTHRLTEGSWRLLELKATNA